MPPFVAVALIPGPKYIIQQQAAVRHVFTPRFSRRFVDVYSTEDWALAMVPQPVLGVVMLFPIKESTEKYREEEAARIRDAGQTPSSSLYYM